MSFDAHVKKFKISEKRQNFFSNFSKDKIRQKKTKNVNEQHERQIMSILNVNLRPLTSNDADFTITIIKLIIDYFQKKKKDIYL